MFWCVYVGFGLLRFAFVCGFVRVVCSVFGCLVLLDLLTLGYGGCCFVVIDLACLVVNSVGVMLLDYLYVDLLFWVGWLYSVNLCLF